MRDLLHLSWLLVLRAFSHSVITWNAVFSHQDYIRAVNQKRQSKSCPQIFKFIK
uniref:Uncharacterized protein n=1 Tax=Anguilla anguilla TaxID=7936 RepID=A0A0E9VLH6_ANGAN